MNMCHIYMGQTYKGHNGRKRRVIHIDREGPLRMAVVWFHHPTRTDAVTHHCYLSDLAKWAKEFTS